MLKFTLTDEERPTELSFQECLRCNFCITANVDYEEQVEFNLELLFTASFDRCIIARLLGRLKSRSVLNLVC